MLPSLHGHQKPARDVGKEQSMISFSLPEQLLPIVLVGKFSQPFLRCCFGVRKSLCPRESRDHQRSPGSGTAPASTQTPLCQLAQPRILPHTAGFTVTLLAATSQAANEELWPRFVPCRTLNWLIPQFEPHRFPPANTSPIQIQKQSQQNLCHPHHRKQRGQGSPQQQCTPLQTWVVPPGHL